MSAARCLIHPVGGHGLIAQAELVVLQSLLHIEAVVIVRILNDDVFVARAVHLHGESLALANHFTLVLWYEHVVDALIVDLHKLDLYCDFGAFMEFVLLLLKLREKVAYGPRYDPLLLLVSTVWPVHCECFTAACLSISEDRRMEPTHDLLDEKFDTSLPIDALLRVSHIEDGIELEVAHNAQPIHNLDRSVILSLQLFARVIVFDLLLQQRPYSHCHLNLSAL